MAAKRAHGSRGLRGVRGLRGATGGRGASGAKGATGERGATGPRGDAGERGATGERGAAGERGATGPPGPKMQRADVLAMLDDQFFGIRHQLDMQLRRTGELQAQLDQMHKLLKRLANEA